MRRLIVKKQILDDKTTHIYFTHTYMSIALRLKQLVDTEKNQSEFARKTGIKRSSLSSVLHKDSGLRSQALEQIALAYPKLNLRWLLSGIGEMWLDAPVSPTEPEAISGRQLTEQPDQTIDRLNELLEQRVKTLESEIRRLDPERAKEMGIE